MYEARDRIAELERQLAAEREARGIDTNRLLCELAASRERREAAEAELRNIANAKPSEWGEDVRDQFRPWAQSRARNHFTRYERD